MSHIVTWEKKNLSITVVLTVDWVFGFSNRQDFASNGQKCLMIFSLVYVHNSVRIDTL